MKTYTAWGRNGIADTVVEGECPPRFQNGKVIDKKAKLVWTIKAASWTSAMKKYHKLQGWEPYRAQ